MFLLLIVGGSGFLLLFKEQADKLMSESEEKYRTLVEKANESICIIQDRKVVFANGTASELLGVSQDNLIGRPFTDFIFPDDMEIVMSYYVGRSEKREIPDSYNFRVMNQKGEPIWVLNSATLIEYGGKQAVIALITNINKLKLMEKERERMIEELKKALATVKTLSGLLPICASCKKIRDDKGYWNQIESYISDHSEAEFSHAICPECSEKLYPELYKKK
jgi:PAS domain S-box-containing protein